jgi:hypothetical protein
VVRGSTLSEPHFVSGGASVMVIAVGITSEEVRPVRK